MNLKDEFNFRILWFCIFSGASFADALLGMSDYKTSKKKPISSSSKKPTAAEKSPIASQSKTSLLVSAKPSKLKPETSSSVPAKVILIVWKIFCLDNVLF